MPQCSRRATSAYSSKAFKTRCFTKLVFLSKIRLAKAGRAVKQKTVCFKLEFLETSLRKDRAFADYLNSMGVKRNKMKKTFLFLAFLFFLPDAIFFGQEKGQNQGKIHFNPWQLIIYRPQNTEEMNMTRSYVKIEDGLTGQEVTYDESRIRKAQYEWVSNSKVFYKDTNDFWRWLMRHGQVYSLHSYKKKLYLDGGMAIHLNIAPGKYKITVYTKKEDAFFVKTENKGDWLSNEFYYDTENPLKVIFVCPTADQNGFYTGAWHIDYKAPQYYLWTKPLMQK